MSYVSCCPVQLFLILEYTAFQWQVVPYTLSSKSNEWSYDLVELKHLFQFKGVLM